MASPTRRYMPYSPSRSATPRSSPHPSGIPRAAANAIATKEKYLAELLAERHNIKPFGPILPHSVRLLNEEIMRVASRLGNASLLDQTEHGSQLTTGGLFSKGVADMSGWASQFQSEVPLNQSLSYNMYESGLPQPSPALGWLGPHGSSSGLQCKKSFRMDIPVDKYPTYNFVGRLLGPRGLSLKRLEELTGCRVLIRGHGSIKDPTREEMLRGKPGYEHLNEPLHVVVEAEMPVEIIDTRLIQAREILEDLLKPVDESHDFLKKQQLRELAILNGTLREEVSPMPGSLSPFQNSLCMKRPKTKV